MNRVLSKIIMFFKKYNIVSPGKNTAMLAFLFVCLIGGMVVGAVAVNGLNMEMLYKMDFLFLNDFKQRITQPQTEIFISSFFALCIFAFFLEFITLSFWGTALVPATLVFRGFGLGLAAGYLYVIYGLKGIAFYILILLPGIFVSSVSLILFSAECMKFSLDFARVLLPRGNEHNLWGGLKTQIKKLGYCLALLVLSSFIDTFFMAMFSRFFNF